MLREGLERLETIAEQERKRSLGYTLAFNLVGAGGPAEIIDAPPFLVIRLDHSDMLSQRDPMQLNQAGRNSYFHRRI